MTISKQLLEHVLAYIDLSLIAPLKQRESAAAQLRNVLERAPISDPITERPRKAKPPELFTVEYANGMTQHFTGWEALCLFLGLRQSSARVMLSKHGWEWKRPVFDRDEFERTYYIVTRGHHGTPNVNEPYPNVRPVPSGRVRGTGKHQLALADARARSQDPDEVTAVGKRRGRPIGSGKRLA